MIIPLIISVLTIMAASLIGGIFLSARLNVWLQKNLRFLITFSMGVFIVVTYQLINEIVHESSSYLSVIMWMIIGVAIVEGVSRLLPGTHHHHDTLEHNHDHDHKHLDARRVQIGDALHNIGDGILLTSAFLINIYIGITTAIAILIHELAQETSKFFILKEAGYNNKDALTMNFLVSSTSLIGVGLALYVSSIDRFEIPLLSLAAGSFIYVILRDLLPHTLDSIKTRAHVASHTVAFIVGVLFMLTIATFVTHSHEHKNSDMPHMATSHLST